MEATVRLERGPFHVRSEVPGTLSTIICSRDFTLLSTLSLTGAGVLYHSILTVNTFINPFRFLGGGRGRSGRRERDSDGMIGELMFV